MTFDPLDYWRHRGERYERDFDRSSAFDEQERQLLAYLTRLDYDSVIEVGCGFGRITQLVRPHAVWYTAIDVSPDQIRAASQRVPDVSYTCTSIEDFQADGRQWDLVLAVEVLMHVPPESITEVTQKLLSLSSRHVVTVDWVGLGDLASHNWVHDYRALFSDCHVEPIGDSGQAIFHVDKGAE